MSDDSPLTTTFKLPGVNAPWVVIRSENSAQLDAQLSELMANSTFATIGRAQDMFEGQFNLGKGVEARGVTAPQDTGAFTQPPAQQAQQSYPQADVSGVPFQQQAQPAPQQYAQPQQYQPPQTQYQQQPAPQQYAQPQQAATPGAPLVLGQPAKLVSGTKNGRQWNAWADPRPKSVTDGMERTDDPNHPGINMGTHSLWKFIR